VPIAVFGFPAIIGRDLAHSLVWYAALDTVEVAVDAIAARRGEEVAAWLSGDMPGGDRGLRYCCCIGSIVEAGFVLLSISTSYSFN
jgi:hypothetical protein